VRWPAEFGGSVVLDGYKLPAVIELDLPDRSGYFTVITVNTAALLHIFPEANNATPVDLWAETDTNLAPARGETQNTPRRGRRPTFDAKEFYAAVALVAHYDELPKTQAEAIEMMSLWCQTHWGRSPELTWLKDHLSPIYRALAQGRKFIAEN
jgi:hypothetical protein